MSNLLNNGKPKKRLLDRGPKIVPTQEFKLEEAVEVKEETPAQEEQHDKLTNMIKEYNIGVFEMEAYKIYEFITQDRFKEIR